MFIIQFIKKKWPQDIFTSASLPWDTTTANISMKNDLFPILLKTIRISECLL